MVKRGDIWLSDLDPTVGHEIKKRRPCLVISPPEIHDYWRIVIVAPMTTGSFPTPYRIPSRFRGTAGLILLDQLRAIDKTRLVRRLGTAEAGVLTAVLSTLQEMFSEE